MDTSFQLFPEQASSFAGHVDALYMVLLAISAFFTALICVMILYFAVRYRRSAHVDRAIRGHGGYLTLEITWTLIPLFIVMAMFAWGAVVYFEQRNPPADALEIAVVGKQWMWKVQHAEGRREINTLHVPQGRNIRLSMISEDVIHDLFIPAFRTKMDVLPGRYTSLWFRATQVGEYHLFCAEYCGTSHSEMRGTVVVMEPSRYAEWLRQETGESAEAAGERLFREFYCNTCHREEEGAQGPPLRDLFSGRPVRLADGREIVRDMDYVRESIYSPQAKRVAGYETVMPTYEGRIGEEGVFQIMAYLKSLSEIEHQVNGNTGVER